MSSVEHGIANALRLSLVVPIIWFVTFSIVLATAVGRKDRHGLDEMLEGWRDGSVYDEP